MKKVFKRTTAFIGIAMLLIMFSYTGCDVWPPSVFKLQAIGDFQYRLKVNIEDNSDFFADDAYIIGWEDNWNLLLPMDLSDIDGWAEIILEAEDLGIKSFAICNQDQTKKLKLDKIIHPLVISKKWIDAEADEEEKVLAFEVDSPDSFKFILSSPTQTTTTIEATSELLSLEAQGDYEYLLKVNIEDYSHIAVDDAYVIGWEHDWDSLLPTDLANEDGWVEIVLQASGLGVRSFAITNQTKTEWLWIEKSKHRMVVPTRMIDESAGENDKVLAIFVDSPDSFMYLDELIGGLTTTSSAASTVQTTSTTTTAINNEAVTLQSLGDGRYELTVNIATYSNMAVAQAKIVGWEGNWDQLIPMEASAQEGWAKKTLVTNSLGIKYFNITNNAVGSEWLWTNSIKHLMVVPSSWVIPGANPNDKILAFEADSAGSFKYIEAPISSTSSTTTTILGPEVVYLDPRTTVVAKQSDFTISLIVTDVEDIFGVAFDLNFDPLLLEYVSYAEGSLLKQNCSTLPMVVVDSAGKINVGVTRLGAACGGISGPGQIIDFTFRALSSSAETSLSFSDYNFCILKDQETDCSFSPKGSWSSALVSIQ